MTKETGDRWEKECESAFHVVTLLGILGHPVRYKTFPSTLRIPKHHLLFKLLLALVRPSHKTAIKVSCVGHVG